jgi:hypothetical protein
VKRVLIANRGEIALRIVRACHEEGVEAVAVYSAADRSSPHVRAADLAVAIGPPPPSQSYLDIERLVQAAAEWPPERFHAETGIARRYMTESNAWFQKVLAVEPRWNRMIVYPGTVMHSGDIAAPELLSDDPRRGRLTINGFFACTRALAATA